ncbi:MAG: hypothetical protein ABSD28_02090 [Tepidisphaeraceae bacterium]|jgi:hypothetical protein
MIYRQVVTWLMFFLAFNCKALLADSAAVATTRTSGALEFHVLADNVTCNPADLKAMETRLEQGGTGPLPQPGDTIRWAEVDRPEGFDIPGSPPVTHELNGKHYLPILITPDASMTKSSAEPWAAKDAHAQMMQDGSYAIAFVLDDKGRELFASLTTRWYNRARQRFDLLDPHVRLAIVVDDKIISAPNINSPITGGSGIIEGSSRGFAPGDLNYLIHTLNADSPSPATVPSGAASPGNPGN